ncbi:UNVERIFIED_CONTAM: dihydrolipoyl dehydrogenase, partial [Bacillus subtilis]
EEQGITIDRGFVITNERLHTGVGNSYAVGDIVPGVQLAHRGFLQGLFVADEIAGNNPAVVNEDNIPKVTFSNPEIASVGLSQKKAEEKFGKDNVETSTFN